MSEAPKITLPPPPGTRPEREKTCWQCGETFFTSQDVCPTDGARLVDLTLDDDHDPLVGTTIDGRYRVKARLGEGGMGTVYDAWDPSERQEVAIKVLKADYLRDENIRRRFMHEARIISNLEHPNAVRMHDFGQMPDGNFYMVMELLKGESLAERLAYKFLTYEEIFNLVPPICDVLAEAHEKGVVHRDLKPENIFIVTGEDGEEIAKLIDFGVSKNLARQTLTQTGTLWGTPAYMSPEQARGDMVGAGADIYAMGIILFELICGHLPFTAETQMGYAVRHMHSAPRSMLSIPGMSSPTAELDALVLRTLAKHPEERPPSMEVFSSELREIIFRDYIASSILAAIPAQEIDPQGLQEWVAQDADPSPQRDPTPTHAMTPPGVSASNVSMEMMQQDATSRASGRTAKMLVGVVGVLLVLVVILGVAASGSSTNEAKADAPSEGAVARKQMEQMEQNVEARVEQGVQERVEAVVAGKDEAAGQGASRAAAMVIRAQLLTQSLLPGERDEVAAKTTPTRSSSRGKGRKSSKRSKARKPSADTPKKKEDKVEDALKGTF